jgi:UDP-glucose 4-epimerase
MKEACAHGLHRFILVSSGGTVYGRTDRIAIPEEHATNPTSPYGIAKLTIEKWGHMLYEQEGLPVVITRPGNVYGEGQVPFRGQGFVATAIASLLENREILLFGEGDTVRDYIHVDDVADGLAAVLDRGIPGDAYNLGTGVGKDNRDVLGAIEVRARPHGMRLNLTQKPARKTDVPWNVLNCDRIRDVCGWQSKIDFEAGMDRAWNYYRERHRTHV